MNQTFGAFKVRCIQSLVAVPRFAPAAILAVILDAAVSTAVAQSVGEYVLSTSSWVADAPTKVALAMGAFDERFDVVETDSGKASFEQLLAGEADFATVATTPVALYACHVHARVVAPGEVHPVILASMALSNDTHFVLANGARGIARPADLAGRRVGTMFDTSAHRAWFQFARLHGLRDADIELVDIATDRMSDALLDGTIDAGVMWAPWERPVLDDWGGESRRFSLRAVNSVNWLLVARQDLVARRPEVVTGLLRSYSRAIVLLNKEPRRARRLHARVSGVELPGSEDRTVGMIWHLELDWSLLANAQSGIEWCEARLGRRVKVPIGRFIEPGPLQRAAPGAVMLPDSLFETEPAAGDAR